jgi:hypothetical protein
MPMRYTAAIALLALLSAAGCSQDRKYYASTPLLPLNYELVDTARQEVLWAVQVPVDHELMVDLDRAGEVEWMKVSGQPATSLRWAIYRQGERQTPLQQGELALSGSPVLERLSYRPAPEQPGFTPLP